MSFLNRQDAAERLIPHLEKYRKEKGVVLAVPRGGVPIGYHIARHFNFPMELILTKKIGHPSNPEFAIGAVSLEEEAIDDRTDVDGEYLAREIERIRKSLRERYRQFMGDRKQTDLSNKTVIIIDDGIATGHTLLAAIKMIRKKDPGKIIVAVPVAPRETATKIRKLADQFICLLTPRDFFGVGQFYEDFSEVTDEEVARMLREANHLPETA